MKEFKDALTHEVIIGGEPSPAPRPTISRRCSTRRLGAKFRIVTGYRGSSEITLAMRRARCRAVRLVVVEPSAQHPDWLKNGMIRVLVQEHAKGHPDVTSSTCRCDRLRQKPAGPADHGPDLLVGDLRPPLSRCRPGVPPDRVAALRNAFIDTLRDPELLADAARGLEITPISGERMQTIVAKLYTTPPEVVKRLGEMLR